MLVLLTFRHSKLDFRLHAQGLTLAALAGAALVEYYDQKSGKKHEHYDKYFPADAYSHKD